MKARRRRGATYAKVGGAAGGQSHLLQSFHPEFRRQIKALAERSSCIADLATTFPGLLFALATGYGSLEARQEALGRVEAGAALREAAEALGLPWWLRRLPPEAFTERLAELPADGDFGMRIVNLLPAAPRRAAAWLERVLYAYRACDAAFALWVAKHDRLHASTTPDATLPFLAAWAWYSSRPETTGGRILRKPWTAALSPRRAIEEMAAWRKRVALTVSLSARHQEAWLESGSASGYDFIALRTAADFIAESEAMQNCLDGFADKIDAGASFVFSVRQAGRPVADVEIGFHPVDVLRPTVVQLRGPRNRRASAAIWSATYSWLGSQPLRQPPLRRPRDRRRAWREFWKPYLDRLGERDRAEFERLTLEIDRIRVMRSRHMPRVPRAARPRPRRAT